MNTLYCCLRIKRRLTPLDLLQDTRKNRRHYKEIFYDPHKTHLNQFGSDYHHDPKDVKACVFESAKKRGASFRKKASLAVRITFIASSEYFETPVNMEKVEAFKQTTLDAVEKRWPGATACWSLILDQTTPYMLLWLCPTKTKISKSGSKTQISVRDDFSGPKWLFSELQTWYAHEVKHLGLSRGKQKFPKISEDHITPKEYHLILQKEREQNKELNEIAKRYFAEKEKYYKETLQELNNTYKNNDYSEN